MIDLVYILDIAIVIIVLGYRGRQNGMLPESFFCFSTLIAGLAAELNYKITFELLSSALSSLNKVMLIAIAYALLFIIIRLALAFLGLQVLTRLRTTPFIEPINKIFGIGFAVIKAILLISIILRFIAVFSTLLPDITGPVDNNGIVVFFRNLFDYLT